MAEASSVHLSPDCSAPGSSGESGWGPSIASSPVLAGPSVVLGHYFPPRRLYMGDSRQDGSPLTGGGYEPSPPPEAVEVASEGAQLIVSGLSTEVVETILQSRAPSMRNLYALKWKLFISWCGDRQLDPVNCPVGTVLEYLQCLILCRVDPLHPKGLHCCHCGLPRPSWWPVSGQTPPS